MAFALSRENYTADPSTPLRSGRDDKGDGSAYLSSGYDGWTEELAGDAF
jgi:hypothetical protein